MVGTPIYYMQRRIRGLYMNTQARQDAPPAREHHISPAERWIDAINNDDLSAFAGILATEFVDHHPLPGQEDGLTGLMEMYAMLRTAFPDWQITVERMLVAGDTVAVYSTWRGTYQGEFLSVPPTGAQFTVPAVDLLRIAGDKCYLGR